MSDPRCECITSVLGDGCRYCQPQSYIDSLEEWLDEQREIVVELEDARAGQESVTQLSELMRGLEIGPGMAAMKPHGFHALGK